MMELIRQWIVGITGAALILALTDALIPGGSAKKVGRLAGGLLMMLAVVQPLVGLDYDALAQVLSEYRVTAAGYGDALEQENERLVKAIIEEQTAAYISDKAEELGMDCTAEVTYHYGTDGAVWPEFIFVRGHFTEQQREALSRYLEAELAVPEESQTFERVTEP